MRFPDQRWVACFAFGCFMTAYFFARHGKRETALLLIVPLSIATLAWLAHYFTKTFASNAQAVIYLDKSGRPDRTP
jgi:hypothetical protein